MLNTPEIPSVVNIPKGKKVYFASDFHLGAAVARPQDLEKKVCNWLDSIKADAHAVFLLGDIFDFWYEYKKVVPRGFVRFIGKLAEMADSGIKLYLFHGNHDMWMFDYFPKEVGAAVIANPISLQIGNHRFHIGHGDGLGPGEKGYKLLRNIFRNKACIWLFRHVPPVVGMGIAHLWSRSSRIANQKKGEEFKGEENEFILQYCKAAEAQDPHDYYIFGHRHLVLDLPVGKTGRYLNLGEWVTGQCYIQYDGQTLEVIPGSNR